MIDDNDQRITKLDIIGRHFQKFRIMMEVILIFFIISLIGLIIYWFFDENNISVVVDNMYLIGLIVIGVISIGMVVILILNKQSIIDNKKLAVIFHVYSFLLMAWATSVCIMDLRIGLSPFIFLIAATLISSLFVLHPMYFTGLTLASFLSIIIFQLARRYEFFSGPYGLENTLYFSIFGLLIIVISFRHFNVTMREFKALHQVEHLTYYDELTSLLNERSYIAKTEEINKNINNGNIKPFIVVLMDVNNLKNTNDKYGHRYGCHLVVRTGYTLKEVFKTSSLYHIGGDEFLAIVEGEDYDNFEQILDLFDQTFRYSLIEYEGKKLVFSVARGYAKYEEGDFYKDVLQRADDMMYSNKAEIKSTYKMKDR